MTQPASLPAVIAYLPIVGWLYVYFFQRKDDLAVYHLRQSIGLCLFLLAAPLVWAVVAWLLAWIPFVAVVSIALFALVITAYFVGVAALIVGLNNALNRRSDPLPIFGQWASRLPIR